MNDRHALRPDLTACVLEDRVLMAIEPGLSNSPFMAVSSSSNQWIVPGTSTSSGGSGGGGSNSPGPSFFYIMLGSNSNGSSVAGSRVGGSVSMYSITNLRSLPTGAVVRPGSFIGGGGGGGSAAGGGGGGGTGDSGGASSVSNFGGSFSSGYGFGLNAANQFGMASVTGATTTLGSVPVHTYGGGGDQMDMPENQGESDDTPGANPVATPNAMPGNGVSIHGPSAGLYDNLLGRKPAQKAHPVAPPPRSSWQ